MPRTARSPKHFRPLVGLATAGVVGASVLGIAGTARAASVNPTAVNSGNPTCADSNSAWTQLKVDAGGLHDGTYSDGTLTVKIANYHQSVSPTAGSFDWSSNIGVDAVFVKAGSDRHNLYQYAPESKGDTDLGPQAGQGNGISHISFCYDADAASTPTTPTTDPTTPPTDPSTPPTDPSTPPTDPSTPPADPSTPPTDPSTPPTDPSTPPVDETTPPTDESTPPVDETTPPVDATPSTQPSSDVTGDVAGVQGTPGPTLPSTDTLSAETTTTDNAAPIAIVLLGGSLIAMTGLVLRRKATSDG